MSSSYHRQVIRLLAVIPLLSLCLAWGGTDVVAEAQPVPTTSHQRDVELFAPSNLVAWCIVPFDAKQRTPADRAVMVKQLGLTRVAYDWRDVHVASFEEEILAYQKQGIEFFAFWSWHDAIAGLVQKHHIQPQFWVMLAPVTAEDEAARVKEAAQQLLPMVEKTRELDCKLGIYNHGGWGGEPANMVAVCRYLREHHQADHVGIVYNLHHGHEHMREFPALLKQMQPFLLCLNLNGMAPADTVQAGRDKILPIGAGDHDLQWLNAIRDSDYTGPVGVIHHRETLDAEVGLRQNLEGLRALVAQPRDGASPP